MNRILKKTLVANGAHDAFYQLDLKCDMCDGSRLLNVRENLLDDKALHQLDTDYCTCLKCQGLVAA
jgi:hypothetical protein